jgi:hypothetical protein
MKALQFFGVLILLYSFSIPQLKSQSQDENIYKYWYYRDRLEYFVMPGTKAGQSLVAAWRNQNWAIGREAIGFGQQYTRMGFYLGMLATEYKLLKDNNIFDELPVIVNEIDLALEALIRTDLIESSLHESLFGNNTMDYLDGFFVREDVPPVFHINYDSEDYLDYFNRSLSDDFIENLVIQQGYYGKPAKIAWNRISCQNGIYYPFTSSEYYNWEEKWPESAVYTAVWAGHRKNQNFNSQDEVIGVLVGLALVYKLVDETALILKAREIANRLTLFMWQHPRCSLTASWMSYFPDCTAMGETNGGDHRAFSIALNKSRLLFGLPLIPVFDAATANAAWEQAVTLAILSSNTIPNVTHYGNYLMTTQLLCLSDYMPPTSPQLRPRRCIYDISKTQDWDTFYLMLYSILHDKSPENPPFVTYDIQKLINQLNDAPCGGPFNYRAGGDDNPFPDVGITGWRAENKFVFDYESQQLGSDNYPGIFHGLDYMLLYNMASICFPYDFPAFINYRDRYIYSDFPFIIPFPSFEIGSHTNPITLKAIRAITSESFICEDGNVTFIAGEYIDLLPGFEALSGSEFTAILESYNCNGLPYKNYHLPPWDNNNLLSIYDSTICITPNNKSAPAYLPDSYSKPETYMSYNHNYHVNDNNHYTSELLATCYPNPATDYLTLSFYSKQSCSISIEIYDNQGILCYSKFLGFFSAGKNETTFSIEALHNGNYSLRLKTKNIYTQLNFVKI